MSTPLREGFKLIEHCPEVALGLELGAEGGMSNTSQFGSFMGGAASGAGIGSVFGPWGTVIGGAAGGLYGLFAGG